MSDVKIGDIYRDKDSRMDGRHLKVVSVEGLYARCADCTPEGDVRFKQTTRISLAGLAKRFERVGESSDRSDLRSAVDAARGEKGVEK